MITSRARHVRNRPCDRAVGLHVKILSAARARAVVHGDGAGARGGLGLKPRHRWWRADGDVRDGRSRGESDVVRGHGFDLISRLCDVRPVVLVRCVRALAELGRALIEFHFGNRSIHIARGRSQRHSGVGGEGRVVRRRSQRHDRRLVGGQINIRRMRGVERGDLREHHGRRTVRPRPRERARVAAIVERGVRTRAAVGAAVGGAGEKFRDDERLGQPPKRGVRVEGRTRRTRPVVVMHHVEIQHAIRVAAHADEPVVAVVIKIPGADIRLRIERPRAVRHFGCGVGAVNRPGAMIHEALNVIHADAIRSPAEVGTHAFRLVENFPRHERRMSRDGLHHRDKRVGDVRTFVGGAGQKIMRPRGDRGTVGRRQHIKRPEAENDADVIRRGVVQHKLQITDGSRARPGDR